jgi:hypothetical protein
MFAQKRTKMDNKTKKNQRVKKPKKRKKSDVLKRFMEHIDSRFIVSNIIVFLSCLNQY